MKRFSIGPSGGRWFILDQHRAIASCGSADIAQLIVDALNANVRARA